MTSYRPVYRQGFVHVNAEMCPTCVYRPGNLMQLRPGRLADLIAQNQELGTALVCHENMSTRHPGVCHGFYASGGAAILQIAGRLGVLRFQTVEGSVLYDNTKTTLI